MHNFSGKQTDGVSEVDEGHGGSAGSVTSSNNTCIGAKEFFFLYIKL